VSGRAAPVFAGLALCVLAGCVAVPRRVLIPIPPERVGAWTRLGLETPAGSAAPEALRADAPSAWIRVAYFSGALGVQVNAYGFASDAAAAAAAAHNRLDPEDVQFQHAQVLVVCSSTTADRDTLAGFAQELEAQWLAPAR
jgi:hypothetical protein